MAAEPVSDAVWDERQAYKELLYWDSLIQRGHRLLPHDFDRYEELRYWYDCLCYEEELRQYHEYITAIQENEENRSQAEAPPVRTAPRHVFVSDDRHVMAKHSAVYPSPGHLDAVQAVISHVECALKAVSDLLDAEAGIVAAPPSSAEGVEESAACPSPERVLHGVMRVGLVAKGLLLKGDTDLELVLLCSDRPTVALLQKVADSLSAQMEVVAKDLYEVTPCPEEADIVIRSTKEAVLTLILHLTSPMVRQEAPADVEAPPDGPPGGMNPRGPAGRLGQPATSAVFGRARRCGTPERPQTDGFAVLPSALSHHVELRRNGNATLPWPELHRSQPYRRFPHLTPGASARFKQWGRGPELAHLIS